MELTIISSPSMSLSEWRNMVNYSSRGSIRGTTTGPPSPPGTLPPVQISHHIPAPLLTLATARKQCSHQTLSLRPPALRGRLGLGAGGMVEGPVQGDSLVSPPARILAPCLRTGRLPILKIMRNTLSSKLKNH